MKEWHCVLSGQSQGPFDEKRIREMIGRGEISRGTLAWSPSTPEDASKGWRPAGETELAAIFTLFEAPPIPAGAGMEPASRWRRLAGVVIEACVLFVVWYALLFFLGYSSAMLADTHVSWLYVTVLIVALLCPLTYLWFSIRGLYRSGQCISKRLLGMKLVAVSGERAPLWKILLLRNGAFILLNALGGDVNSNSPNGTGIALLVCGVFLVDICMIFTKSRRTLRDRLAGMIVVMAPKEPG